MNYKGKKSARCYTIGRTVICMEEEKLFFTMSERMATGM